MQNTIKHQLHPVERAGALEGWLRTQLQNPEKIVRPYIKPGMTVLELGCGPGFFTTAIAKQLNNSGKVIAADLQAGMLDLLKLKIQGTHLEKLIEVHQCQERTLGLTEKVEFVFAFYVFHEVTFIDHVIEEIKTLLKPDGTILIAEQKLHVPKSSFDWIINKMINNGFEIKDRPRVFFSRTALMKLKQQA